MRAYVYKREKIRTILIHPYAALEIYRKFKHSKNNAGYQFPRKYELTPSYNSESVFDEKVYDLHQQNWEKKPKCIETNSGFTKEAGNHILSIKEIKEYTLKNSRSRSEKAKLSLLSTPVRSTNTSRLVSTMSHFDRKIHLHSSENKMTEESKSSLKESRRRIRLISNDKCRNIACFYPLSVMTDKLHADLLEKKGIKAKTITLQK